MGMTTDRLAEISDEVDTWEGFGSQPEQDIAYELLAEIKDLRKLTDPNAEPAVWLLERGGIRSIAWTKEDADKIAFEMQFIGGKVVDPPSVNPLYAHPLASPWRGVDDPPNFEGVVQVVQEGSLNETIACYYDTEFHEPDVVLWCPLTQGPEVTT